MQWGQDWLGAELQREWRAFITVRKMSMRYRGRAVEKGQISILGVENLPLKG